ncbi:hypothetical protein HS088_TW02G00265 [Tripterygium wilfordii]|uniref:Epidermal patterning factor-like protein n=1 Tax=Tripterygium wilfordii TaxID=458696 RepID=A0A7J7DYJ2_TRIWF|nr:uncharacterized protein LOC119982281 [Tripterygium wilfordii]KAF5751254.1 hypothetical protein HS088_TW02G00265 [Tripterygium wilfordii]
MMKERYLCFVLAALQVLSWASSRNFAPNDGLSVHQSVNALSGRKSESLQGAFGTQLPSKEVSPLTSMEGADEEAYANGKRKIGSSPPSCEHKCYGCIPCEAIQVPSTSNHLGVQYTNYEPEGWKCKCGPTFYSP